MAGSAAVLALIAVVAGTVSMDNTIVAAAAGTVAAQLVLGLGQLPWLSLGYVLPYAVLLVPAGPLVDRVGERAALRWGGFLFGAGALLSGLAWTGTALLTGRLVQGVAAAAMVPAALALVRTGLPRALWATGSAAWLVALACGLAGGPVLGGALTEYLGWRWVFWSAVGCGLAVVLLAGALPERVGPVRSAVRTPSLGRAVWLLVRAPGLRGVLLVQLLWGLGVTGIAFFTPLVHQELLHAGPYVATLPLLAVVLALIAGTPLVDRAVTAFGVRTTVAGGLVLLAGGFAVLAVVDGVPAIAPRLPALAVIGFGAAFTAPLTTHALNAVLEPLAGTAAGLLAASRELSGALGVALVGALLTAGPLVAGYTRALVVGAVVTAGSAVLASLVLPGKVVRTIHYGVSDCGDSRSEDR